MVAGSELSLGLRDQVAFRFSGVTDYRRSGLLKLRCASELPRSLSKNPRYPPEWLKLKTLTNPSVGKDVKELANSAGGFSTLAISYTVI